MTDREQPELSLADYTFIYQWKRTLTDVDMKRRRAAAKERSRLHIDIVDKIANPTLGFEVKNFRLFNSLKQVDTEVHNTIPSPETVNAEKDYIEFQKLRKCQPDAAQYNNIYASIQREASKPRTPSSVMSSAKRSLATPRGKFGQPSPLSDSSVFPITPYTPTPTAMYSSR